MRIGESMLSDLVGTTDKSLSVVLANRFLRRNNIEGKMTDQALKNLWGSVGTGSKCLDYYSKWAETYDKVHNSHM